MKFNITNLLAKITGKKNAPITDEVGAVALQDQWSTYPSKNLTPPRLASLLVEADGGDILRQMELFEEMLEKDAHLQALFQARRLAVSRRNYSIIPASEDTRDVEIANEVDLMLKRIKGWKNSVNDMLDCVPKGFSVNELFWTPVDNKYAVTKLKWRHQKRFRFGKPSDMMSNPEELRLLVEPHHVDAFRGIVTDAELAGAMIDGISLVSDPRLRQRFIVTYCKARSGHPGRASLLRTCTYLFLFKNYDVKWWVKFAEVMLGYRVGKYDPNQPGQKEIIEKAVRGLGQDSAAVISKESEIDFKEMQGKASSHQIYGDLAGWCNDEMTKAVLGHTGAVQSVSGELGGKDVAKDVRQELIESDAQILDEAITDDIIKPFIDYNFGPQKEYPYYHTEIEEEEDLLHTIQVVQGYQGMGGKVSKKWAKEKFGIPEPEKGDPEDEALQPPPPASPFLVAASESKKKLLTSR